MVNPRWLQHLQVTYSVCHTVASQGISSDVYLLIVQEACSTLG